MDKNIDDYISISEYAKMYDKNPASVRQKVLRGGFKTARKIGRNWVIDRNEPFVDGRVKSGEYKNWRKK